MSISLTQQILDACSVPGAGSIWCSGTLPDARERKLS